LGASSPYGGGVPAIAMCEKLSANNVQKPRKIIFILIPANNVMTTLVPVRQLIVA
jgi:hypothetical protein